MTALTGAAPDRIVALTRATRRARQRHVAENFPHEVVEQLAETTLAAAGERRSTWTRPNLLAEAARATRTVRARAPADRLALLDRIVDAAIAKCVALDPPAMFTAPTRFTRPDGTSVFTRPDEHAYTTREVLDAEARLQAATATTDAPAIPDELVAAALTDASGLRGSLTGRRLTADQQTAVVAIATSARRVDVLVGPAGTGKTRTLHTVHQVWEAAYGSGSVIGLAPSSTAAAELGSALGIPTENVAKWLHESTRNHQQPPAIAAGARDDASGDATATRPWRLQPGQLLIVDEASMVATRDLDVLVTQAARAGAKVALVGDHHQLGAVGAGGAFALLADQPQAVHLEALWRFQHRWEAQATRGLRAGDPAALDAYADHGRLHDGPVDLMRERAYAAWATDLAAGHSALLLAADRATVTALNVRARADRVHAGFVAPVGVPLSDETTAGRGDVIVTRRNARYLQLADGGHVRNGDLWTVTGVHADGSIDVSARPRPGQDNSVAGQHVRLPASYVREQVELGYAATVHRAQGMTVDHAHLLTGEGMTRQALYVAMTRGRDANHAYIATDGPDPACPTPTDPDAVPTGRQVLERVLLTDGAELSATAMLRRRQDEATSSGRLRPIRDTLTASSDASPATSAGRADAAAADEIAALIRARFTALRAEQAAPRRGFTAPTSPPRHDGISR